MTTAAIAKIEGAESQTLPELSFPLVNTAPVCEHGESWFGGRKMLYVVTYGKPVYCVDTQYSCAFIDHNFFLY